MNKTTSQSNLIDMYRMLQPTTAEYTLFSSLHGTFTKVHRKLGHKISLRDFRRFKSYRIGSLTTAETH